jgi:hypothetical protein
MHPYKKCGILSRIGGGGSSVIYERGFGLEPGSICLPYSHNKLQSPEVVSSAVCVNNSPAVELEFLWDQLEQFCKI